MSKPSTKGEETRQRILDVAEAAVLKKGFGATSIEEITANANITRSGFLYHFKDKTELAKQILLRYLARDDEFFFDLFRKADAQSEDPLHSFLIFLKLLADAFDDLPATHPGCLAAVYSYQEHLFSQEILDLNGQGMYLWRERFHERLLKIEEKYPVQGDVDLLVAADSITAVIEGAIIMSNSMNDKDILKQQILLIRDYFRRIFGG